MIDHAHIADAFARHERIGFQFSGGRDSTAALYLLRDFWQRMTVYHVDSGDQFPETREVVEKVAMDLYVETGVEMVRMCTNVEGVRAAHGLPSDIVPVDNTELGRKVSGREVAIQSRYECCVRTLMLPMHGRMLQDGITLIVRGQRDDEYAEPPMRSGQVSDGFEVLYPIQDWAPDDVMAYLRANGLPLAPFYERGMRRAPECMGCTAWWDEGRAAYMRAHHPVAHATFERRIQIVRAQINGQAEMLATELESCNG